jgi:hypothetical protein
MTVSFGYAIAVVDILLASGSTHPVVTQAAHNGNPLKAGSLLTARSLSALLLTKDVYNGCVPSYRRATPKA